MAVVLGIDAAWTVRQPSGVALLDTDRPGAKCLAAAPSYSSYLDLSIGGVVDWNVRHSGDDPPVAELLSASTRIAGKPVDVVAIDMPVSTETICGRRAADNAVTREFGGRWCPTHSPNGSRPGPLGASLTEAFLSLGYPIATTETAPATCKRLLEVYPHTALLALLERDRRVPYKIAKAGKYWPRESLESRISLLLREFRAIESGLSRELGHLPFTVPVSGQPRSRAALKAYEDALDAVASAWVGWLYLQRRAAPLGDATAAVWCPAAAIRSTHKRPPNTRLAREI